MNKILILEDNKKLAAFYKNILISNKYETKTSHNSSDFLEIYSEFKPELIILDIKLNNSRLNGIEVFEYLIKKKQLNSKVIILSGEATRTEVAKAMKLGAYTFIEKTGEFNTEKFLADVRQAINLKKQEEQNQILNEDNKNMRKELLNVTPLIGESSKMLKVKELIQKFAHADVNVLLLGETGTGKEVVAKNLYWNSKRAGKPFKTVHIGGLNENLIDAELFGHKKGAFTGAISDKKGYFEQADKGILFLDEMSDLNFNAQAKILRAIEYKEIQIVGGNSKKIDVNFIFASNRELQNLIKENKFREDLYYRLEGNIIQIPPLRERRDDIILLMEHFFNEFSRKHDRYVNIELKELKNDLLKYRWGGNVRELEHFCERLFNIHEIIDNEIILEEFQNKVTGNLERQNETLHHLLKIENYKDAKRLFKNKYLQYHLNNNNGNKAITAEKLGIERSILYKQ